MNRSFVFAVTACAAVLVGCGHTVTNADGSSVTMNGNQMQVTGRNGEKETISNNGQNVTVQSKDGTATYSQNGTVGKYQDNKGNSMESGTSITEQELGYPFYPGSVEAPGSLKATSSSAKSMVSSVRTTTDDPAKVLAFYTDKIGTPKTTGTMSTMTTAGWQEGEKQTALIVDGSSSPAKITLMVTTGK
ncbi:MAG TPA: hypothetical protein VGL56_18085 [Fimbriimonadaceae bacterium]|jgi:hypothetical protein